MPVGTEWSPIQVEAYWDQARPEGALGGPQGGRETGADTLDSSMFMCIGLVTFPEVWDPPQKPAAPGLKGCVWRQTCQVCVCCLELS